MPILEDQRTLPTREYDVVVAGGGTAGVVAALASARSGARTALLEAKGYVGGTVVEGGTALHSYYNLWKAFPEVEKRQIVKGIPQEIVDRLVAVGGATGHAEMTRGYDYDSVCTAIDTELYKLVCMEMLVEAGVTLAVNTWLAGAAVSDGTIQAAVTESRSGREAWTAATFVDSTGYGDLAAHAGAPFTEPNDYAVANSIGVAGVSLEKYHEYLDSRGAVTQYAEGRRSGAEGRIVRVDGTYSGLPEEFAREAGEIGMSLVTTSVHDDYFMFIKLNYKMDSAATDRDAVAAAELELRRRQHRAVQLFREFVPGCEHAFIARTSPSLCIRRGRLIECDYDIRSEDVLDGRHFDDDVFTYGFHDLAPRLQIRGGGTYGIPYRALLPKDVKNLLVTGMMITSNHDAHMSTRNTVACMGQGQAAGHAAALCTRRGEATRSLPYETLRRELEDADVYLETPA